MISYLRINDPYRIIFILFFFILLRIPLMVFDFPLFVPELSWMLLGEKITSGALMYNEVEDNTGILSAYMYGLIDLLFGRSRAAYMIIASALVFFQALLFNIALTRWDIQYEKSYLPAFFYCLFASCFLDFYTLSPILLATTFVILSINKLFRMLKTGNRDEGVFMIGFNIGVATLFYFPSMIFILLVVFTYLLYTNTILKRYMILLLGFILPLMLLGVYYYWKGGLGNFLVDILYYSAIIPTDLYMSFTSILFIIAVPALFLVFAIVRHGSGIGFVNYQVKCQRLMITWVIIALITLFVSDGQSAYHYFIFLPPLSFFVSNYFMMMRRKFMKGLLFYLLIIFVPLFGYSYDRSPFISNPMINTEALFIDPNKKLPYKSLLILGEEIDYYQDSEAPTRFIKWKMAERYFERLDNVRVIADLEKELLQNQPKAIIDMKGYGEAMFYRLPHVEKLYRQTSDTSYVLKQE